VGYKYVLKHFPHEVNHLEECLALVKKQVQLPSRARSHLNFTHSQSIAFLTTVSMQDKVDHDNWETTYVLIHWLAALCLIPFDICSMDSTAGLAAVGKSTLVVNIVQTCKSFMQDTGPTREAASICLSVLLTRPDMENAHLQEFMAWSTALLGSYLQLPVVERNSLSPLYFHTLGVLHCLFQIFKLGHRFKLLPHGPVLLPLCLEMAEGHVQTSTRKLITKLVQRIGMNFLPPRLASWRYMRGNRSLNLRSSKVGVSSLPEAPAKIDVELTEKKVHAFEQGKEQQQQIKADIAEEGEEDEVPAGMEDVVDRLLISLQDKDTVVRWSAAKGLGRITMRLSQDLAADVIDAVIEVFSDADADSNWHGGCLALAELSRRGLLLPDRLAVVMPFIERAIRFDLVRGQHSIGAHVRDAACYVCWAFSRAYSPTVMSPYIRALTNALLITALFDREVNCRRAASAAYQETVGRQGDQNVPNGITIITIADYFSVGNRLNCFTCIAASVAALDPELNVSLMLHLATSTIRHWDRDMRELAALALATLAPLNVAAAVEHLGRLVESTTSANLNLRHGSIMACAELLFTLATIGAALPESLVASIVGVVASIEKGRLFRGTGGALIREAVCCLIKNIARARLPLSVKMQVSYVESLNEHLRQPHESVQFAARDSLREFLHAYFASGDLPSERLQKLTVQKYMEGLSTDTNVSVTRGCALALGVVPVRLVLLPPGRIDQVLELLEKYGSAAHRIGGEYDANTCCNCIAAVDELAGRLSGSQYFTAQHLTRCIAIFSGASEDYSVDKRGDTGSWSRTAAMRGMQRLVSSCLYHERKPSQLADGGDNEDLVRSVGQGTCVNTSFGAGLVSKVILKSPCQVVVEVEFPADSTPRFLCGSFPFKYVMRSDTKHFAGSSDLALRSGEATVSLLREQSPLILCTILKQLAEKLDAVREVAGSALLALIRAYCEEAELVGEESALLNFPDYELVVSVLQQQAFTVSSDFSSINWANPSVVYPVVCGILKSRCYFAPIMSGLVLSVGGLSETTAKCSAKALLDYCGSCSAGQDCSELENMADALVRLLAVHRKCDRVIVPALKTIALILNEGVLDALDADFLKRFTGEMYAALSLEARGTTNVTKLCVILDLLMRFLSLYHGPTRHQALQIVFSMLTHKYPRVRKRKYICRATFNTIVLTKISPNPLV